MDGDSSVAYIDNVAVLRDHRGKGIAIAMLTYSLNMHYQAGRKSVALHVDASNLTGALRLYEKAGMKPVQTSVRYEKVLREGVDLVTRALVES
jgi:ribosomal protein S18 acetylase RimI-like enzyme